MNFIKKLDLKYMIKKSKNDQKKIKNDQKKSKNDQKKAKMIKKLICPL